MQQENEENYFFREKRNRKQTNNYTKEKFSIKETASFSMYIHAPIFKNISP